MPAKNNLEAIIAVLLKCKKYLIILTCSTLYTLVLWHFTRTFPNNCYIEVQYTYGSTFCLIAGRISFSMASHMSWLTVACRIICTFNHVWILYCGDWDFHSQCHI